MSNEAKCGLCGEPMPPGEEMFNYHGYSGPCPKPPITIDDHDHDATFNAEQGVSFDRHTNGDVTVHLGGLCVRLRSDTWISAIGMMSAAGEAAHETAKALHRGIGDGV